ncbi:MAG TPA: hypothetical protein PKY59_13660 [Pyrinomonadaceae bacterium]|nr:hypothetical protein [Pyrinomonadaceae bacterium]
MFLQGNLLGFGMFVATALIVVVGKFVLNLPDVIVMSAAGAGLVLIDLIFRILNRANKGWLTGKQFGGYLYFAPVWIFGIIVILINVINFFVNKKG